MNWLSTPVASYSEATSGDTENRDPIAGRDVAHENYPLMDLTGTARFTGIIGNSFFSGSDSDYFLIDIRDGYRDTAGSVDPGSVITFTATRPASLNLALEARTVDEGFLQGFGPYGGTVVYLQSTDTPVFAVQVASADQLAPRAYLAFQVINYSDATGVAYEFSIRKGSFTTPQEIRHTGFANRAEIFDVHTATLPAIIQGGAGGDVVWTGQGNDFAYGGLGRDIVIGDNGNDFVYGESDITGLGGSADQILGGGGNDTGFGGGGDDYMNGEWGRDTFNGGTGNDLIYGGLDADILRGDGGNDELWGGSSLVAQPDKWGPDVIVTWDGTDGTQVAAQNWNVPGQNQSSDTSNDRLYGGAGNDRLFGQGGGDWLDGGSGGDTLVGGEGNDTYFVDSALDVLAETNAAASGGTDHVFSFVNHAMRANFENLTIGGTASLYAVGNTKANVMVGNTGNNVMMGGGGNDIVRAGAGHDIIYGGTGRDTLTGGAGFDRFTFDTALTSLNVDTISDFVAQDDTVGLENSIFTRFTVGGTISSASFRTGSQALDGNDYIVYNPLSGAIFYDADGSGAGAKALFFVIPAGTALSHLDFFVM